MKTTSKTKTIQNMKTASEFNINPKMKMTQEMETTSKHMTQAYLIELVAVYLEINFAKSN